MGRPKLLILDEPCLGLAPIVIDELYSIIREINQSGVSVLLAEQNVSLALRLGMYGYVLEVGKIILQGDIAELRNNEIVSRAYLGE
jgi:branched-chain amino acid transport system ATP-binding protein